MKTLIRTSRPRAAIPIGLALTMLAVAGCAPKPPAHYISSNFVPAGMAPIRGNPGIPNYQRTSRTAGDPNVSAAVKAHVIRGLPGSVPNGTAPMVPNHP